MLSTDEEHDDYYWMQIALDEALIALDRREVPVGCIILLPKESSSDGIDHIVARGSNESNETGDATRHAEIVAIERAYQGSLFGFPSHAALLKECLLYVTCEPCIMCTGALCEISIKYIIFGCRNDKFGGVVSVLKKPLAYREGIMENEAVELFGKFFKRSNPQSKAQLQQECS